MRRPARLRAMSPLPLAAASALALGVVLGGGWAVARAVDGTPTAATSPAPAAAASSAAPAEEPGGGPSGGTNAAVATGGKDGRTVYAIRLKIVKTSSDTVAPTNAAIAVNEGCTGCSTVAIAFEGVLVTGSPTDFEPTNLALAANIDCSGCTAFADAYQQVVQTSTRVRISKDGRREVARIRKDLKDLTRQDLTLDEIRARVAADEQAFAAVLRDQLVPVGNVKDPAPDGPDLSDDPSLAADPDPSATPAALPTPTPTATPTGTTAASPTRSPAPARSASPSPTATPTATASPSASAGR